MRSSAQRPRVGSLTIEVRAIRATMSRSDSVFRSSARMTTASGYCAVKIFKLIDWCFTARQHKIGQFEPIYQGGLLSQAFEDSQQGTYNNIQLHAIQ